MANLTNSMGTMGAMGNPAQIMKNARKSGMPANIPQMPSMADITGMIAVDFMKPAKLALPDALANVKRWHAELSARPSASA